MIDILKLYYLEIYSIKFEKLNRLSCHLFPLFQMLCDGSLHLGYKLQNDMGLDNVYVPHFWHAGSENLNYLYSNIILAKKIHH